VIYEAAQRWRRWGSVACCCCCIANSEKFTDNHGDCMLYDSSSPEVVQRQIDDLIAYKNVNDLPLPPSSRLYDSV
jgi:hypothetical protein